MLWRKSRQRRLGDGNKCAASYAKKIEERRRVAISRIHLIPESRQLPRFKIGGDQGRLARPWRRRDPDYRMRPGIIPEPIQPFPGDGGVEPRSCAFDWEGDMLANH